MNIATNRMKICPSARDISKLENQSIPRADIHCVQIQAVDNTEKRTALCGIVLCAVEI